MTRTRHTGTGRPAPGRPTWIAALPALALAVPAPAQAPGSVQDYKLPPPPAAPAAGPVDSDHPVVAPPTTPAPAPTPAPAISLPSPPARAPAAEPAAPAVPRAQPSPRAQAQPAPAVPETAQPAPTAPAPTPTTPITAAPEPMPSAPTATEPAAAPATERPTWPWIAGGAAAALLLAAFLAWRRRTAAERTLAYEAPAPAAQPEPGPPATLTAPRREPARAVPPSPVPPPAPAANIRPLEMQLEARHLSRAMINATLAYRLTLTNRTAAETGPLRIAGDIVSAHASLSAEEQLVPGDAALATIHEVPSLAPGESVSLSGELRLPIASILPIRSGAARVFVPLARFRAEMQGSATMRIFVVGQASEQPGGALRPFPLDRGPGIDRGLDQRELETPA